MPKKIISKQQIINAAQILVASDRNPTLAAVRKQLNCHGSNSTIHRYLKEWKKSCLVQGNINTTINLNNQTNIEELIEKQYNLEKTLQKQTTQNEHYAQELINVEKTNIALKEENHQLQIANQKLQLKLTAVETANNTLLQTTQEINNRLDVNDNKIIQNMQKTIDDLRMELKILNETSLTALRETSNKGHETLMQEKVIIVNLQAKIDSLNKELLESKKQLNEALIVNQVQTKPLLRQIEWQQKIIQEYIGVEKLQHQKEELGLQTTHTTMVGTSYGK